jgi:hypothetical protein
VEFSLHPYFDFNKGENKMACKTSCKLCKNLVISQSVTIVTVDGTDTLVIDLPARTYGDNCKICIVIAQTIPATATITTPVAFSIGGDTTTVYPFVRCDCSQVTACAIRTRTRYSTRVSTNAVGGVFKSLGGLSCCPSNNLESLPVPATATTFNVRSVAEPLALNDTNKLTKTTTTTTKEVLARE